MARGKGQIGTRFRRRMVELDLDEQEVEARAKAGVATYDLLGSIDDNEFYGVWSLALVKQVVEALELNLLDLLGLKCAFCSKGQEQWRDLAALPRNEIIRRRREELALSKEELLAKLGYTQWFAKYGGPEYGHQEWAESIMSKYRAMEDSADSIEQLVLDSVMRVAKGLKMPIELLLDVRCPRCTMRPTDGSA